MLYIIKTGYLYSKNMHYNMQKIINLIVMQYNFQKLGKIKWFNGSYIILVINKQLLGLMNSHSTNTLKIIIN